MILVPNSAVQTLNEQSIVRVMKNGKVSEVIVEVTGSNDTQAAIASGLNEGDVVVTATISSTTTTQTQRQGTSSVFGGFGGVRGISTGSR